MAFNSLIPAISINEAYVFKLKMEKVSFEWFLLTKTISITNLYYCCLRVHRMKHKPYNFWVKYIPSHDSHNLGNMVTTISDQERSKLTCVCQFTVWYMEIATSQLIITPKQR